MGGEADKDGSSPERGGIRNKLRGKSRNEEDRGRVCPHKVTTFPPV